MLPLLIYPILPYPALPCPSLPWPAFPLPTLPLSSQAIHMSSHPTMCATNRQNFLERAPTSDEREWRRLTDFNWL